MEDENKIAITICGDGGCGKSSITLRLVKSQWMNEYDPTIEDSYSVNRTVDGRTYLLSLTDTAGQEEYRGLWTAATLKADAFLFVYDITNPASMRALDHFITLVDMETEHRLERAAVPPVKIVAGNKCDLGHARQVTAAAGLAWARANGCGFMETSARELVNVEETFALLVRRVVESRRQAGAGVKPAEIAQPVAHTPMGVDEPAAGAADAATADAAQPRRSPLASLVALLKSLKCR